MDGKSTTVVFADDDGPIRDALVECLRDAGLTVHPCGEGHEALALCKQLQPDVVLLDLNMPGLDGYEAARAIRTDRAPKPVRLIALTGFGNWDVRRRALDAGFDEFLTKPISTSALVNALTI